MFSVSPAVYDALYVAKKDYAREAEVLDALIRERQPDARTLLDVACGTGLHLAELRQRFEVEGLDLSPTFAHAAGRRNPGVTIHEGDMRSFDTGRTYDAVVCLFSSIGYAASYDELARAIRTMGRHLSDGGVIVIEPWFGPDRYRPGHVAYNYVKGEGLEIARMCKSVVDGRMAIMDMHYLIGDGDGVHHCVEHHEMLLAIPEEYERAFADAGLDASFMPDGFNDRGVWVGQR